MKGVADAETASVEVNQEGNFLRLRGGAIWKVEARGHAAVEGDHQALEGDTSGVGGRDRRWRRGRCQRPRGGRRGRSCRG